MNLKIKLQCFEKANSALKIEYFEYFTCRNFHFNAFHFVGLLFTADSRGKIRKKKKVATGSRKFFRQKYSADLNFQFIISDGLFVCLPLNYFFFLSGDPHTLI